MDEGQQKVCVSEMPLGALNIFISMVPFVCLNLVGWVTFASFTV